VSAVPAPAPVPELALLERAIGYTRCALVASLPVDPAVPTPCSEWDLGDLLTHMLDSLHALDEAGRLGQVGPYAVPPPIPRPATTEPLVMGLQESACDLLAGWSAGGGEALVDIVGSPLRAGLVAAAGALEVAVHGWDVGRAVRIDHPLPDALAEDLLTYLPLLVTPADRPHRFAAPLPVRDGAPAPERLLALLGRPA
jgi:uncharacterized protein (TIGR03086 family)